MQEYGITAAKPAPWQQNPGAAQQVIDREAEAQAAQKPQESAKLSLDTTKLIDLSSYVAEPSEQPQVTKSAAQPAPPPTRPEIQPEAHDAQTTVRDQPLPVADLAASFQEAVVDALVEKTVAAAAEFGAREVLVAGGVAANALLRQRLDERLRVPFRYPPLSLCTDNAAMIAAAAYYRYADSLQHDFALDIEPNARYV